MILEQQMSNTVMQKAQAEAKRKLEVMKAQLEAKLNPQNGELPYKSKRKI